MEKIKKIKISEILKNGGATLNSNGDSVNFKNGYQVAKKDCYKLSVKNIDKITQAINKLLTEIKKGDFVGVWCESGFCYIDISERVKNLKRALILGKARKQISVFSWADATCIYC